MAGSTLWIVAIAALGSLALQAEAGVADGVKIRECWWLDRSSGKPVPKETNLNTRGVAGGRCFATMEFERRSSSFTRCEDSYTKNAFSWPAVKGKRVRVIRLGICGDADAGSGSTAFQFRGVKGTTEWVSRPRTFLGRASGFKLWAAAAAAARCCSLRLLLCCQKHTQPRGTPLRARAGAGQGRAATPLAQRGMWLHGTLGRARARA